MHYTIYSNSEVNVITIYEILWIKKFQDEKNQIVVSQNK